MSDLRAPPFRPRRLVLFFAMILAAVGCGESCCDEVVNQIPDDEPACRIDTVCPTDGDAFRNGECGEAFCSDVAEDGAPACCPGSRCRSDIGICSPVLLDPDFECEQDADCPDSAQRCVNVAIGARPPLPICVFETCAGDSDCGFGRACFHERCVSKAPCDGGCPQGQVCDVVTSTCAPVVAGAAGCDVACEGANILVTTDPDTMSGETCCEVTCECKAKPPLVPSRYGRYARVAVTPAEVLVSAYDAEYGDLVLGHYSLAGVLTRLDYLDGIAPGAPVVADPAGIRGGVAEVGPNVGTHTSIAVNAANRARIAYHDVDGSALKVAIETDNGAFSTYFLDGGAPGSLVGIFTDIAIAADGTVWVSYLAHDVTAPGITGRATALKVAKSRNPNPASAADWDLFFVDARRIEDGCGGTCGANQICISNGGAPQCAATAPTCSPACESGQCVILGGQPSCAPGALGPESREVPRARGLYTSIVVDGTSAIALGYDAVDGDVRGARVSSTGGATLFVLDGDGLGGRRTGDVGRFPQATISDGQLLVVYEDFSRHEVVSWKGPLGTPGTGGQSTVVENGRNTERSGSRFVGAGAAVAAASGGAVAVYQDASFLDLRVAREDGASWSASQVLVDGAHGFYSDVAVQGSTAFIVSVLAELDGRNIERSRLALTVRELQ